MKLQLRRPLVFFDLETTGTDIVHDRIVQISTLKLHPDGFEEVRTRLINPECPIPRDAIAIHGIADADVVGQLTFGNIAPSLFQIFSGCDIAGFNSNRFDLPLLVEEFARCNMVFPDPNCNLIDVQTIFHKKEERTLSAAYKFYCNKVHVEAHDAEADVRATLEVFRNQLERYDDIGATIDEMHKFCNPHPVVDFARFLNRNENGDVVFNFGKYAGKPVQQEREYAEWMLRGEFPEATKLIVRRLIAEAGDPSPRQL
jgi:DNA polymerase-3 subunit epsilon